MKTVVSLGAYKAQKEEKAAMTTGKMIKMVRNAQYLSQDGLGKRIGYSQPEVSRLENGKIDILPETMALVGKVLGNVNLLNAYCDGCPVEKTRRLMVEVTVREVRPPEPQPPKAA
jgi:transcriptional regulator with XRE-family HTH domain